MKHKFALVIAGILAIPCFGQVASPVPGHFDANHAQLQQMLPQSADILHHCSQFHPSPSQAQSVNLGDFQASAVMKHKLDSIMSEIWAPGLNVWQAGTAIQYTYDHYGNLSSDISRHWNSATGQWLNESKGIYQFLSPGKPSLVERHTWDFMSHAWRACCRYAFAYDASGRLTNFSTWEPLDDQGNWGHVSQVDYTYDEGNQLITEIYSYWYPKLGKWKLSMKIAYEYDESYLLSLRTEYIWKQSPGEWSSYYKQEFSYDNLARNTMLVDFFFDTFANEWIPVMKSEKAYHDNGKISVVMEYAWYTIPGQWQQTNMTEYYYHSQDQLDYLTVFHWDNVHKIWVTQNQNKFSYASGIPYSELVLPYSIPYSQNYFDFMLNEIVYYGYLNGNFSENIKETFSYSSLSLIGIEEITSSSSKVYPVPAQDYFMISWQENVGEFELQLYDLCGRLVKCQTVSNHEAVNVLDVGKGLYTYKLTDKHNSISMGKICIQ